ncbi:MAG: Spy/CpxP family protein refolding chaperone [Limnospira sp. PMC 1291.21]|uniref:Spy/CpxP family protein refolding chaperone n=1 Tax=unclassified Limnospira TaxID=2642885 RepID=UPI0028E16B44|nr:MULTISPECIES: Spy/CpxP family protein refolding chaperone [unclassified Limnospira]MDT9176902.1 Spy/CpxP family protein refolding chaperone [Limnospira sp. PMC 1238.20]MDT9193530.1 Spy/CpxP family protein refolding chaperone [Limnospira sp. PMC 1245.20]MDT9203736.1 Spy/CpxP family protein refolding chaperone [Limnospira sp. PMC 1243.20]MDT9207540.1 Spy/CpxP family protein refolding chaperone [Limnospira sp. PMC 1252.20]MDT9212751.1 Spy/CpxP family protein refolding chaperone [Limnospira sp.
MNMQRLFSLMAATALIVPITTTAAFAGPRKGQCFDSLNLTPQQQEMMQAIRDRAATSSERQRQELQASREQMRSLQQSNASPEQLRQQRQRIQELSRALSDQRFETMLEMREVLTPEQRSQLQERMGERQGRGRGPGGGPGNGRGPGGGPGNGRGPGRVVPGSVR